MKQESLKEKAVEQVYDYLVKHGMGTPLQLEHALGVDIKLVRAALNSLEKEGRIAQRYVTIPQYPRLVTSTQVQPFSTPPRIMPIRVPESARRRSQEQIQKARVEQQRARERQREIKKKSTIP